MRHRLMPSHRATLRQRAHSTISLRSRHYVEADARPPDKREDGVSTAYAGIIAA